VADPWVVLGAAVLEGVVGYPDALHAKFPHPVTWLGQAIGGLDRRWNLESRPAGLRRTLGVMTLVLVAGGAGLVGFAFDDLTPRWLIAIIGAFGLAARSLHDHVHAVLVPLAVHDLPAARTAVGRIVGRDTDRLDPPAIAAASLESLAESFNDGVVAPLFWFLLGGLAGLFAYKAVNTADSMIGHMEPRWRAFGWAAAKTDDVMNWIPARITGGLITLIAARGFDVMRRDARKHASPNSGWPEAAMAGALGVKLGGPVSYDRVVADSPYMGDGSRPGPQDLAHGLSLYRRCLAVLAAFLLIGGLAWRL
jgi:adenosylcobinamide-phosphate synthase